MPERDLIRLIIRLTSLFGTLARPLLTDFRKRMPEHSCLDLVQTGNIMFPEFKKVVLPSARELQEMVRGNYE